MQRDRALLARCARLAPSAPACPPAAARARRDRRRSELGALRALARAMSAPAPGLTYRARSSVWRTERPFAIISLVSSSGSGAVATARAWPMLISPRTSDCLHEIRKIEQSQQVSDMTARLVDELGNIVLRMAMALDQLPIALGLFDRVEVFALDIFDQRDLGRGRIVDLADDRRDRVKPAPAAPRASGARRRRSRTRHRRAAAARSAAGRRARRSNSASSSIASSLNWTRGWSGFGRIRPISISRTPPAQRHRRSVGRRGRHGVCSPRSAWRPRPSPDAGLLVLMRPLRGGQAEPSARAPGAHRPRSPSIAGRRSAPAVHGSAPPTGARCAERPYRTPPHQGRRARRRRPAARACCARSNIVSATPRICSSGLKATRIRSTVCNNWLRPSSAKNSHCRGTSRCRAATRPLTVRRPSDGGQSIRQMSQRLPTASSADSSRRARSWSPTSSTSAPDRSMVAGRRSRRGTRVGTTLSTTLALPISTS